VADGTQRFVFVRLGPRRFIRRDVVVGPAADGRIEVLSGLSAGEEFAVQGAFLLKSDVLREKMGAGCAD
jgi:cobalt-zinc-cadmium efflux system membrane fusion protein